MGENHERRHEIQEAGEPSQKQGKENLPKGRKGESQDGSCALSLVSTQSRSEQKKGAPE